MVSMLHRNKNDAPNNLNHLTHPTTEPNIMTTFNTLNTPEIAAFQKSQIEKSVRLSNVILAQVSSYSTFSLNVSRSLISESAAIAKKLVAVQDVPSLLALQQQLGKFYFEAAKSLAQSAYESGNAVKTEVTHVAEESTAELKKNLNASFDQAVKAAPESVQRAAATVKETAAKVEAVVDAAAKNAQTISEDLMKASVAAVENATQAAAAVSASVKKSVAA